MSIISKIKPFFENPVKFKKLCIGTLILNVVGFVGFLNVMEIREKRKWRQQEWHKKAAKMLIQYKYTKDYLGSPLRIAPFDTIASAYKISGWITDYEAKAIIPLLGPKGEGTLHVIASREGTEQSWIIEQLDLELKKEDQRWTFYDRSLCSTKNEATSSDSSSTSIPIATISSNNIGKEDIHNISDKKKEKNDRHQLSEIKSSNNSIEIDSNNSIQNVK